MPRPAAAAAHVVVDDAASLHAALKSDARLGAYLPGRSWGASAVVWAGLPITAAEHVDLAGQIRGAIAIRPEGLGYAVAFPLQNQGALLAVVTAGQSARFRRRSVDGADHLVPAQGEDGKQRALLRGYLVVAGSTADLAELGPFLVQARVEAAAPADPERAAAPMATVALDRSAALRGLEALRDRTKRTLPWDSLGLRLPITWSETTAIRLDADAGVLSLTASLGTVEKGAAPATGRPSRLLDLPSTTEIGLALFLDQASRSEAAAAGADALARGPLGPGAARPIGAALAQIAEARGDSLLLGYERGTTGPLLSGSADIRDAERAKEGLAALVAALQDESLEAGLRAHGLALKAEETVLERVGEVVRARLRKDDEIVSSVLARLHRGELTFCSGADSAEGLRRLLTEDSPRLRAVPSLGRLASLVGQEAIAAAVLDAAAPFTTGPPAGQARSPAFVLGTVERRGDDLLGRIVAEPRALAELVDDR